MSHDVMSSCNLEVNKGRESYFATLPEFVNLAEMAENHHSTVS